MRLSKKVLLIIVLTFIMCASITICFADTYKNEQDGFRDLKWGSSFADVKDSMEYVRTDPSYGGILIYKRATDELTIGAGRATTIEYLYWQEKLYGVKISVDGYTSWSGIHTALQERFGSGYKPNRYMEDYMWFGDKTIIESEYKEILRKGYFHFVSKVVSDNAEQWKANKAKEGAKSGF